MLTLFSVFSLANTNMTHSASSQEPHQVVERVKSTPELKGELIAQAAMIANGDIREQQQYILENMGFWIGGYKKLVGSAFISLCR